MSSRRRNVVGVRRQDTPIPSSASDSPIQSYRSLSRCGKWFATDASKRATEQFFLMYSVVWILVFGAVVATKVYINWSDLEYMCIGLFVAVPHVLVPLIRPFAADKGVPLTKRYFFKANVWIWIFSFVGNYLWTHYFYKVLNAGYTFPVRIQLNEVPFFLYLITHGYFCFYHTVTTIVLRRFWTSQLMTSLKSSSAMWWTSSVAFVFLLGAFTAFMETFTIASVPYYTHADKWSMYTIGSVFYGIYFYVSFPMYYYLDEKVTPTNATSKWTLAYTVTNAFAATMMVTLLLDFWR